MKKSLDFQSADCVRNDITSVDGIYFITAGYCQDGSERIDVIIRKDGLNQEPLNFPTAIEAEAYIRSIIDLDEAEITCVF